MGRAALYQILVYDRFPNYPSETSEEGVRPIWPADIQNPGSSLIQDGNRTSQIYEGPTLIPGHTYYWAVLASDDVGSAFTISPIQAFIAQ